MQADGVLDDYDGWLERQALAARTRSSYRRWVRELVAHLAAGGEQFPAGLTRAAAAATAAGRD